MTLQIEIVSDFVCPYCWLGKKRLEAALAQRPDIAVQRIWRPFELDPDVPAGGLPYRPYMTRVYGEGERGEARIDAAWAELTEAGEEAGAEFRFPDMPVRPNTLDAHRLMRWAQEAGAGDAVAEALFAGNFRDGRDIGDADTLVAIAAEAGLDADEIRRKLESGADAEAVREEEDHYKRMGVTGVPTYIFGQRFGLTGAQKPAILTQALDRALAA